MTLFQMGNGKNETFAGDLQLSVLQSKNICFWGLWRYLNCQYQPISFKLDHVLELYLRCVHHGRVAWPAENKPVLSLLFMKPIELDLYMVSEVNGQVATGKDALRFI